MQGIFLKDYIEERAIEKIISCPAKEALNFDIRVLQYLLAVAREENISKAAETLRMAQPPLFSQLKDLNEELGIQLLIRGSKKVTLTEDGMLLRNCTEELVALMEKQKPNWPPPMKISYGKISGSLKSLPTISSAIASDIGNRSLRQDMQPSLIHIKISGGLLHLRLKDLYSVFLRIFYYIIMLILL